MKPSNRKWSDKDGGVDEIVRTMIAKTVWLEVNAIFYVISS
jgi:hypothetical protein